ncbi:MAG: dihydrolipoyl dehydrogenase [Conexivisphaerales archaeon]
MSEADIIYDVIIVGSGTAMNLVNPLIRQNPAIKIAVIDKDEPGGICLTRGCIPSKIMLYPAELIRSIERADELGLELQIRSVSYNKIMNRMRSLIDEEINSISEGLSNAENIDYYHSVAEFISPYTMKVNGKVIKGKMIFLTTGSRAKIPNIKGLEKTHYYTSDSIIRMEMKNLPKSLAIIGGGYIAAEFGHFFSAMGSSVTILGKNSQFLPDEEPEVSALAKKELGRYMTIYTGYQVEEVEQLPSGIKRIKAVSTVSKGTLYVEAEELLLAAGRAPNNDILKPEKGGIELTKEGWIKVNEYFETSQPNVWAFGDADGRYLFKHVANYESEVVFYNALLKRKVKVDYHAIPHAVFTYPEIASVGMKEKVASDHYGSDNILIGFYRYEDTAKGEAMNVKDYFVKVIIKRDTMQILGAHIIGPYASILIQEIINLMYTQDRSIFPMQDAIHIHPSLSEVVQRAFGNLMNPSEYRHMLQHYFEESGIEIGQ